MVNMLLQNVSCEDLITESASSESDDVDDYTGTTLSAIKILGEARDVDSWGDALTAAVVALLRNVEDPERITDIDGRTRSYFVEEERQSEVVAPHKIPDTDLYLEANFSANTVVRVIERVPDTYEYDRAELGIFTEES
ncbi:hypothetical protein DJ70_13090 [Halorubrum halodurans]|uniref:Uncharacterized protein n=2 Tax=Halorubrum halodurans TaxID=1383851 RepID=A0A256IEP1_9EURY|nr:hypothetical protein DJ70_13090 [Halorubrum halodurans]